MNNPLKSLTSYYLKDLYWLSGQFFKSCISVRLHSSLLSTFMGLLLPSAGPSLYKGRKQDTDRSLQLIYKNDHWSKRNMNAIEKESDHAALGSAFNLQSENRGTKWISLSRQNLFDIKIQYIDLMAHKKIYRKKRHKMSYIRYHVPWISKADQKHLKAISSDIKQLEIS